MKKSLVVIMTTGLVLTAANTALARTEANVTEPNPDKGNIVATTQTPVSAYTNPTVAKDYDYFEQGVETIAGYTNNGDSTHVYGTWNSPYTAGVDGYNYNDAQDYTGVGDQTTQTADGSLIYQSGPHGGYLTSTHRCRECHAVHRAAGKFKLLRSDTRFEACDWCHGTGAGSGFNIQMDNDDAYTTEYNVGHTMGYGIDSGKWRAPDDTYPAYAPNYYMGGFSCFDCHSPHANPARILGFDDSGNAVGEDGTVASQLGKKFGIANPGHDYLGMSGNIADATALQTATHQDPVYLSGSWLLIKNPDRELATFAEDSTETTGMNASNDYGSSHQSAISLVVGQEIPDTVAEPLAQYSLDADEKYPVNKIPTDWNSPIGAAGSATVGQENHGYNVTGRKRIWNVSEFCTDCHDGNAGLHSVGAPLFSEDRALRNQGASTDTPSWKGNYDIAYGHDAQPRH